MRQRARGSVLVSVAAAFGVLLTAGSGVAAAGTFEVVACGSAPGFANNAWVSSVGGSGTTSYSCPPGNGMQVLVGAVSTFRAAKSASAAGAGPGGTARWIFTAAAGSTVASFAGTWKCSKGGFGSYSFASPSGGTGTGTCTSAAFTPVTRALPAGATVLELSAGVGCNGSTPGCSSSYARAALGEARVTVNDVVLPTASVIGGSLTAPGTISGTASLNFSVGDGTGVSEARLVIDGETDSEVEATVPFACNFTRPAPCATSAGSAFSVDTRKLADGAHTYAVEVVDAADNVARSATGSFTTANVAHSSWATVSANDTVLFGDATGDGFDDLITHDGYGNVSVRASNGSSAFGGPIVCLSWPGARDLAAGDVDGDGDDDLVGRSSGSDAVRVALSSGSSYSAPAIWLAATPGAITVEDVDGDEVDDLVLLASDGTVRAAYAEGPGFQEVDVWGTVPAGATALFGDATGDGLADLVQVRGGQLEVRESDAVVFGTAQAWGTVGAGTVRLADADGDEQADIMLRTSDGKVGYMPSTGSAFAASRNTSTLPSAYSFATPDVNGDLRADPAGRSGGDVTVGLGRAAYPVDDGPGWQPGPDTPEDPDPEGSGFGIQSVPGTSMVLAWADDDQTTQRLQGQPETEPDPAVRCAAAQVALDRMRQSGASFLRLNVMWSHYLDAADRLDYRRGLRNAVFCAQRAGLTVYMTITSAWFDEPQPHHVSPSPAVFGDLVRQVVAEFYPLGVRRYAMWNEPNLAGFLKVSCSQKVRTTALYRNLYDAGYAAARSASGNGAIVYIGELSELNHAGKSSCGAPRNTRSKTLSTIAYLERLTSTTSTLYAHGVAWHAYQHRRGPRTKSAKVTGIYKVGTFQNQLSDLYRRNSNGIRQLQTPSGNKPGLYITEFGYFNVPFGGRFRAYWTEATRAKWLKRALDRAARHRVRMFLFWQLNEEYTDASAVPTPKDIKFDTGMLDIDDLAAGGDRPYGKGPNPGFNNPQPRRAFCAVRDWARDSGLTVAPGTGLPTGC